MTQKMLQTIDYYSKTNSMVFGAVKGGKIGMIGGLIFAVLGILIPAITMFEVNIFIAILLGILETTITTIGGAILGLSLNAIVGEETI